MNKILSRTSLVSAALMISGCAAQGTVLAYSNAGVSLDQTSLLQPAPSPLPPIADGEHYVDTGITAVGELDNHDVYGKVVLVHYHLENYLSARVLPGRYGVRIRCTGYPVIHFATIVTVVEPGYVYSYQCVQGSGFHINTARAPAEQPSMQSPVTTTIAPEANLGETNRN